MDGVQAWVLAQLLHTWYLFDIIAGLCNSLDSYFWSQNIFQFFMRQNVVVGSFERNGILKECFEKYFLGFISGRLPL